MLYVKNCRTREKEKPAVVFYMQEKLEKEGENKKTEN